MKLSAANKKLIVVAAIVLLIIILVWNTDLGKTLRGAKTTVNDPAPKNTDNTFNVKVPAPVADDSFPLHKGSRGDNVSRLQKALNTINATPAYNSKYKPLVVDGILGDETYKHVLILAGTQYFTDGPAGMEMSQAQWNGVIGKANNPATLGAPGTSIFNAALSY